MIRCLVKRIMRAMRWRHGKLDRPSTDREHVTRSGLDVDLERHLRNVPGGPSLIRDLEWRDVLRDRESRGIVQGQVGTVIRTTPAKRARPDHDNALPLIVLAAIADGDATSESSTSADSAGTADYSACSE